MRLAPVMFESGARPDPPQAVRASTIASPRPWLPPVMTTRFPFRFCMLILS